MGTLDQRRALLAFTHVSAVNDDNALDNDKYASMVHALPAMIRTAGLCQALHFVASRKNTSQRLVLAHLEAQLGRVGVVNPVAGGLLGRARDSSLEEYLHLTREALACASWYKRLVQSVLGVDAGDANADE